MATNLDRFKKDLDRLTHEGVGLELAMQKAVTKDPDFSKKLAEQIGGEKQAQEFIKKVPNFNGSYDAWYSEALALLRQLLPDRVTNFVGLYEKPKGRKSIVYGNYVIQDFLQGGSVAKLVEK